MPWNGSGTFSRKHNWTNEAAAGTAITAANFDDDTNDITTAGLGNCITRDGQGVPTANIPWGGFRLTNLGAPNVSTDGANKAYVDTATSARSMGGFTLTNLADPVNAQDAATKAWVGANTTALPTQTGNADYVFTTSGSAASWTNTLKASVIKFKDGTDATKLLAFDLSGITTGTTRTLTVPNKSGTIATTADSGLVPLATITPTAAAAMDFLNVFSSAYNSYLIVCEGLVPAANDNLCLRLANAGTVDASSVYYQAQPSGATFGTAAARMDTVATVLSTGLGIGATFLVSNVNDTAKLKRINAQAIAQTGSGPIALLAVDQECAYTAANAVTGFRLFWSGGANFQAIGKIHVYGFQ